MPRSEGAGDRKEKKRGGLFLNRTQDSMDFVLSSDLAMEGIWRSYTLNVFDLDSPIQDSR